MQAAELREQKRTLRVGEVIITADFAENYNCRYRQEVMAHHWAQSLPVVIFTSVVYFGAPKVQK